jgi:2-keto-4-pentenoate hydratase/2-oxohepta-3-ene-1,7-dioic acid hydratase in catechol pathway
MRIVSFDRNGQAGYGLVADHGVIDAGRRLGNRYRTLREVLLAGALPELASLDDLQPDYALSELRSLPVVPDLGSKILCIGSNYTPHIKEMGREPPKYPVIFVRFADSQVGHSQPLIRPRVSQSFDYEGELAIIIGKSARYVPRANAFDYIVGYSCFNDGSIRDWQRHTHQFTPGKNFPGSGAFGPWMVTTDELPDPTRCHLQTRLNGEVMQDADVAELYFDIPTLVEYCSSWTQLNPGDVIVTGTPGGVGAARKPPVWMQPGDTIEVEISGVGLLSNTIVDENGG